MNFTETFEVQALSPFDFELTAQIFCSGDKQIRNTTNGVFSQILYINDKLTQLNVVSIGTVEEPKINVEIKTNYPFAPHDKKKAVETIKFIFNLDFDLSSFYREIENDRVMHQIAQQLYGLKNPTPQRFSKP